MLYFTSQQTISYFRILEWLFRNQMNIHTINRQNIYLFFCSVLWFFCFQFIFSSVAALFDGSKNQGKKVLANWSDVLDKKLISQTLSRCCQEVWISLYFRSVNLLNNTSFLFCAFCLLHKLHNWCLWNFYFHKVLH